MKRRPYLRALTLGGIGLAFMGGPGGSGCSAPFDPPSLINTLRILDVAVDKPYANPGDEVTFTMSYFDGRITGSLSPITIVWIGGCFNPEGGQYYACYDQLAEQLSGLSGIPPQGGPVGIGPSFTLTIPDDIVSSQPEPSYGPKYGLAYVFFVACAGTLGPVDQEGTTAAGSFPVGCFDAEGNQLGPDAFIPGYTQVYVFEDGRVNANPPVEGMLFDEELLAEDARIETTTCPVTFEERRKSGCSATDEFTECDAHTIDLQVPNDVADDDQESLDADGNPLKESVWVSYFATGGTFDADIKLLNDATKGIQEDRAVKWVAPDEPGTYQIWAVVHDNRGGSRVVSHTADVTE